MTHVALIVDDSLTVRMDLAEAFETAGFRALPCASLAEARKLLAEERIAVAVLDVLLPDGDGIDLLKEIRAGEATSGIPVLMLSTEAEIKARIRGMTTGANEYVGKPYDTFYLVARAQELCRQSDHPPPIAETCVLLIDDSPTFREALGEALEQVGYSVLIAATGEEGLRIAATRRPNAIIVDGMLPGIDGSTVIRRIRLDVALSSTPCLMLTGSEDDGAELRSLDSGADAFIRKDEVPEIILARLAAVLRGVHAEASAPDGSVSLKRILAVDDSMTYLHELSEMMRDEGYDVVLARSGEEAIDLLAVQPVDCILMDLLMPGIGGKEACRRIKQSPTVRDIPLLMLTAVEDRDAMIEGLGTGADDYISKINEPEVIKARVRAQLRRKQVEDEHRRVRERLLRSELEAAEARADRQLAETQAAQAAERQLKQVNEELRLYLQLIEGMPLGVLVVEVDDSTAPESIRCLVQNPAMERAARLDRARSIGRPLRDSFPELADAPLIARYALALESGAPDRLPPLHWSSDELGDRVWDVQAVPLVGRKLGILAEDVTGRLRAEAERDKFAEQMHATKRLEAIGQLAGGIAHDFNNVLTVIQAYAGFLQARLQADEEARSDIDSIFEASQRAARLTSQLLAFGRRQVQRIQVVSMNQTLAELGKMLERLIGEDVQLVTSLAPELGLVKADLSQIEQVVMNLVVNARDAMPRGGRLTIETSNADLDEGYAQKRGMVVPPGRYVMVAVSDTGIGMDDETQTRIFEPFFTTKERGKGTGLGLSTVYGIVKQSNGFIWVYSEVGRGTTFKVYLPRTDEEGAASLPPRPATEHFEGTETILLVEDEELVRRAAGRILEPHGYRVLSATNGAEALALAESHEGDIDLLITDVIMPGMNGRELSERLAESRPSIGVVYISGYTDNAIVHQGVLDDGAVLVQKPFSPDGLLRALRAVLDQTNARRRG